METATPSKASFSEEFKRLLPERKVLLAWLVLLIVFAWFHWSSLRWLPSVWWHQEDYQHGFFVPIFSLVLLWLRRDMIPRSPRGSWWGLPLFAVWAVMRWVAIYFNYESLPELSLLPFVAGMTLFVGGWQGLRWAWPSILFMIFMLPLPGVIQGLASRELQRVATFISCWLIQMIGIPAVAQGNVIQLTEKPLEVARACSGLRMMMLFFAICVAAAFLSRQPLWEKLLIVASAADRHHRQRVPHRDDGGGFRGGRLLVLEHRRGSSGAHYSRLGGLPHDARRLDTVAGRDVAIVEAVGCSSTRPSFDGRRDVDEAVREVSGGGGRARKANVGAR